MNSNQLEVKRNQGEMPSPEGLRDQLEREGLSFYRWSNGPGYEYAAHQHNYHKVIVVERGSITFHIKEPDRSVELSAGDRLELPAETTHAATVGPEGVACLEAHLR